MDLWISWWSMVALLRPACVRLRTFLWLAVSLAGMTIRCDIAGVTSVIRALGLKESYYDRLLDFFHSPGINLSKITRCWVDIVLNSCKPFLLRVNNPYVYGLLIVASGNY